MLFYFLCQLYWVLLPRLHPSRCLIVFLLKFYCSSEKLCFCACAGTDVDHAVLVHVWGWVRVLACTGAGVCAGVCAGAGVGECLHLLLPCA